MKSLKRKREERRFVDLRIILILHCGNEFLKQVLNFCFKLDDIISRYRRTIKSFFLGTVGITFLEHELCLKQVSLIALKFLMDNYSFLRFLNFQLPNEIRCNQSKLKSSETVN